MQLAVQAIQIFGTARLVSDAFGSLCVPYSVLAFRACAFLILIFELNKQDSRISFIERSQFLNFIRIYINIRKRKRNKLLKLYIIILLILRIVYIARLSKEITHRNFLIIVRFF